MKLEKRKLLKGKLLKIYLPYFMTEMKRGKMMKIMKIVTT